MARGIERRASVRGDRDRADLAWRQAQRVVPVPRAAVSAVAVTGFGLTATHLATALGVTPIAILGGIDRGREYLRARRFDPDRLARKVLETK